MTGLPAALVVFGASGFIGRNLIDAFAGRLDMLVGVTGDAREVRGCTHVVRASELGDVPPLPTDTVVINFAAFRYDAGRFELAQSDIIRHNAELASRIFDFCAQRKIREMRLASSVAVYPGHLDIMDDAVPVDLNAPPHQGEAFYAWSKRWQEILASLYAERFGLNTIVFRLSNPYGPYDSTNPGKAHVAPAFVMKALNNDPVFPIRGDISVERDFTYVGDVVRAFEHSLSWRGRNDSFNVCTGQTTTLREARRNRDARCRGEQAHRGRRPGCLRAAPTHRHLQQDQDRDGSRVHEPRQGDEANDRMVSPCAGAMNAFSCWVRADSSAPTWRGCCGSAAPRSKA